MRLYSVLFILAAVGGCAAPPRRVAAPVAAGGVPVALQLQRRDDALQGQRYRTLLNFEMPADAAFVAAASDVAVIKEAHTGGGAVAAGGGRATVAIDSVLFGTRFPGDWTLLGTYVRPEVEASVTAELLDGDAVCETVTRRCAAGQWALLALDLADEKSRAAIVAAKAPRIRLTWDQSAGPLAIDDALLIDNSKTLVESDGGGWIVRRRGFVTRFESPGRFNVSVVAAAADERGWVIDEVNRTRAVLRGGGDVRDWVIYADGRSYRDGKYAPLTAALGDEAQRSHAQPAECTVDESGGRLERSTPGDADNDGYNERLGAYEVRAESPRLQVKLSPQQSPVFSPVIEIAGLPAGQVRVNVEGRVIEQATRLSDGRVLVQLPLRLEKPTIVSIKAVSGNATAQVR